VIGGEGRWEELTHLTMVLSRYGIRGQVSGAVGVVGPTHINYGRAISTVRYMSGLMTDMLVNLLRRRARASRWRTSHPFPPKTGPPALSYTNLTLSGRFVNAIL
jgi:hypothetical protein